MDFDMDQEYIPEVWGPEFWQKVQELADNIRETVEQLGKALRKAFAPVAKSLEQLLENPDRWRIPGETPPKAPRPPRYAGPQNKGRQWTRQPQRLARSDCRKMRR